MSLKNIPTNWCVTTIGDINDYKSLTFNPKSYQEDSFELYSVPSFASGSPEILLGKDIASNKQYIQFKDILLCKINPRINRVWCVKEKKEHPQIGSSEWIVIRQPLIHEGFLAYFLQTQDFRDLLCSDVSGVGGSLTRAQPKRVATYNVPIAPLPEQKIIAEKLDTLLAQVESTKARLEQIPQILKRFRQAVLGAAVSGKLTQNWRENNKTTPINKLLNKINEERNEARKNKKIKQNFGKYRPVLPLFQLPADCWEWVCFEQICETDNNALKAGPFGSALKKSDCVKSGHKVYGQEQVISGQESLETYRITEDKYQQLKSCATKPGDILISLVGTIGKTLILSNLAETGIINPRLVKIALHSEIQRQYVKLYLDGPLAYDFFKGFSHGGTMDILNLGILKELPIPLPSLEEQREIVRRVEQLFAYADTIEKQVNNALARVNNLTQSILAKAFRGELTAQWRAENPELISGENSAAALLEKIKAERAASGGKKASRKKS
ncbi:TPA: restriction endonuclease subunit S [Escherichia coli]|uniref:restriction endonuclease subunit S n=1 Tax=Escherichia coli TaxID=562 RepID=UPI0007E91355|nr:restriction endonuclease subunit S [Escherichia coli]EEW3263784.1 restriction endonuclease subunit S [Escherichia coli]MCX8393250.1 restriction endonuclease subunit S [Escherichia coli]MCX8444825.1 restriction endonuclease subunit S [Escherichia coli]MCX8449272.1 restriction endonuclease subunit S [Escherichia coli]GCG87311.1 restriction-modification system protein HsdS [Escherichia coli]